jgi:hypothetical protein
MAAYNTETVDVSFINRSFLDKIDQGLEKEAGVAMSAFVRQRLREDGFTRKILPPTFITAAELDRQLTEEPAVIVEKEPDSIAASLPFLARSELRYFKGARYAVTFEKIASQDFRKSKFELATYRTDIRTVLQENSIKDMQKAEDLGFYNSISSIASASGNTHAISGGFTKANMMQAVKYLVKNQLPVGCILMTQSLYADMLSFPATDIGSPAASDLFRGEASQAGFYGYPVITTIKNDIVQDNEIFLFAPPEYLGQFYMLQDATVFLKTEMDFIEFTTYESIGVGIGNTNAIIHVTF